jgi:hypothetical protein
MDAKFTEDYTYGQYIVMMKAMKDMDVLEQCSRKGSGFTYLHYHAFAHAFNVPVRIIDMDYNEALDDAALRDEWGGLSSAGYARLGVAKEYGLYFSHDWAGTNEFDGRICNVLTIHNKSTAAFDHAVLLGYVVSEDPM